MMTYDVAVAESGDLGALVRLGSGLFREDAGVRDPFTNIGWLSGHGREHFRSLISRGDALCLLAKPGGTPVGYLAGRPRGPTMVRPVKIAEIQSTYVRAGSRDRGIGSALVEEFRSWAGARTAVWISVTAYASDDEAVRLYARRGFGRRTFGRRA